MTREERRTHVIQACIDHQQAVAATARQEMESAQQQSNDYGANVDRYDAYRTKMQRSRDMYAKQLAGAAASIGKLQELQRRKPLLEAGHGAVVITDKQRFFLSVGVGKFLVPPASDPAGTPEVFYAISANTPVYMALRGKRVGDSITVNGVTQVIVDIL